MKDAIAWRNSSAVGEVGFWDLTASGGFDKGRLIDPVADQNWQLRGSADFNSDSEKDLVWRNAATGELGIWYSGEDGYTKTALTINPGTGWDVVGVGDVNGDRSNDLVFQGADGRVAVWNFNGVERSAPIAASFVADFEGVEMSVDANWSAKAVADFTGDGKGDLVWQNSSTGAIGIWEMDGDRFVGSMTLEKSAPQNWQIAGTGDFTGDGKADLLWANSSSGEVGFWEMDGDRFVKGKIIGTAPNSWTPIATFDTSAPNPLAEYDGVRQNILLNFASDVPLSTEMKSELINFAGIAEQVLGGRTNLPENFVLEFNIDRELVESVFA